MIAYKECPACEDGKVWKNRYGGNDPDVWTVTCDLCCGTAAIPVDLNEEAGLDESDMEDE